MKNFVDWRIHRFSWIPVILSMLLYSQIGFGQDKYAVLIGVEAYDPSVLGPLKFTEDDAIELGQSLSELGFKTKVMTGQSRISTGKPSSPKKILRILKTQMNNCADGDTIVISLSGHGFQYESDEPDDDGVRETYFCPEDADPNDKSTLLPLNDVITLLRQCKASRKLMLIDACRNEFSATTGAKKAAARLKLASVHEIRRTIPGGMTVLYSSSQNQVSFEDENLEHSVFSYFVIKYLKGNAESRYYDGEKYTLDELIRYVRKKTNEHVADNNISSAGQTPVFSGTGTDWAFGAGISPIKGILTRHLDWLGGLERLKSIKSVYSENMFNLSVNGSTVPVRQQLWAKDDKVLTKNTIRGIVDSSSSSKTTGWMNTTDETRSMTDKERDFDWLGVHPYAVLDLLDRCDELRLLGKKTVRGIETDVLLFGDENGNFIKWFFAPDGSIVLSTSKNGENSSEIYARDFKLVKGYRVPFEFSGRIGQQAASYEVSVRKTKYDINVNVKDEWFDPPATLKNNGATKFDIDRMVRDFNMYAEELGQTFDNGMQIQASARKASSTSIALDLVVSGLPANLPPEQLQQLRVLVPEVKRQLVAELDDEIRKTLRQGLLLKVNFMSDRGAALFGFNISGNDL